MPTDPREQFDSQRRPPAPPPLHIHYHRDHHLLELTYSEHQYLAGLADMPEAPSSNAYPAESAPTPSRNAGSTAPANSASAANAMAPVAEVTPQPPLKEGERHFLLPVELLRVFSPSAEVRGHSPDQAVLQTGKRDVGLLNITAVGNYAIKLHFDDGHDSGIYSWAFLFELAVHRDAWWRHYLHELASAGASRAPLGIQIRQL